MSSARRTGKLRVGRAELEKEPVRSSKDCGLPAQRAPAGAGRSQIPYAALQRWASIDRAFLIVGRQTAKWRGYMSEGHVRVPIEYSSGTKRALSSALCGM
jgi:hypothetical protein